MRGAGAATRLARMGSDKREPLARVVDIAPVRDAVAALDAMLAAFYGKPPSKDPSSAVALRAMADRSPSGYAEPRLRARMFAVLGMLDADDAPAPRAGG